MEDGFGDLHICRMANLRFPCLNPCFSGRWFRSKRHYKKYGCDDWVLILVLVEDGFGVMIVLLGVLITIVLILVLVEDGFGDMCMTP